MREWKLGGVLLTTALWLGLASSARAQADVPLAITGGDVQTVKVDRVIVVKEDLLLVRTLPFNIAAPAGGFGYQWQLPAGFEAVRKANSIEVKAAPKGAATVTVEWYVVDFDKRLVLSKIGSIAFAVGDVPGPGPPDPPDVSLLKRLKDAYAKETATDKALAPAIAAACRKAAAAASDPALKLVRQVNDVYIAEIKSDVGAACPNLLAAIKLELNARLPRSLTATLDAATRATVAAVFTEIANGLGALP